MVPDEATIGDFLTFAPEADEGQAFAFIEGASSLEEAVSQFYENPKKFSKDEALPGYSTAAAQVPSSTGGKKMAALQVANGAQQTRQSWQHFHTNHVIQAANVRARDEQEMQNRLQTLQLRYRIFNADIEPEHDSEFICRCDIHQWQMRKLQRLPVQEMWSQAVMYPGERSYSNCNASMFSNNPYKFGVLSPYDPWSTTNSFGMYAAKSLIDARRYTISVRQTIGLNANLNAQAQRNVDKMEPQRCIWEEDEPLSNTMAAMSLEKGQRGEKGEKGRIEDEASADSSQSTPQEQKRASKSWFKKTFSSEHRALAKQEKQKVREDALRGSILQEENGRWPSAEWRQIVDIYQQKVGMKSKIAELRARQPIQYSHLLRAGYFEPIPVAWADQISNPLKFIVDSTEGWRGITPAWRGFEDTAEERLYWVLNHREGSLGARLKPDQISALNMALERMSRAVEPPPEYFSSNDTCHIQHTSKGYSRQVMAPPFVPYDQPETARDDTMILLDVSGSMDFAPMRPVYNEYFITGYDNSTQPKNKDTARAIVRRFVDAMINHSQNGTGYDLTTFANHAEYVGVINHRNFDRVWGNVRLGGGTRVMTGWQKVKQRHFEKHSASAMYHPVYGWQAGPQTPMLRLLLLLDGEATDMDEFELDLLGNSWAHVTIFLIGVDGCPHHHRHANELQRISEVNHHVSFVDAQGNTPERLVTHELLKRHLGYDVSMAEFQELEQPPPYSEM